jgi:hypothetical protein
MTEQGTGMTGTTRATSGLLKGRKWVLLPVAAILTAIVTGLLMTREQARNPIWNGHRLNHYVDLLPATYRTGDDGYTIYPIHTHKWQKLSQPQRAAKWNEHEQRASIAREAIVQIGTEGLPWLIQKLGREDSAVERALSKSPQWIQNLLLKAGYRATPTPTYHQRWQVVTAMRELNEVRIDMHPVMTDLLTLATNQNPGIRLAATFLIKQIDPAQFTLLQSHEGTEAAPAGLAGEEGD